MLLVATNTINYRKIAIIYHSHFIKIDKFNILGKSSTPIASQQHTISLAAPAKHHGSSDHSRPTLRPHVPQLQLTWGHGSHSNLLLPKQRR